MAFTTPMFESGPEALLRALTRKPIPTIVDGFDEEGGENPAALDEQETLSSLLDQKGRVFPPPPPQPHSPIGPGGMPWVDSGPPADPTNSPGRAQMLARQAAAMRGPRVAGGSPAAPSTLFGGGDLAVVARHGMTGAANAGFNKTLGAELAAGSPADAARYAAIHTANAANSADVTKAIEQTERQQELEELNAREQASLHGSILSPSVRLGPSNAEFLKESGGGYSQSGRGPGGGAVEKEFVAPAKPLLTIEDTLARLESEMGGRGGVGAYKDRGNIGYVKNDAATPATGPKWVNPNTSRTVDPLSEQMGRYSESRQAQREALAKRYPGNQNMIDAQMGENQNGRTDISRLRAMAGTLQREGLSPEQAMAGATVLGQERGDPATPEQRASAKALYEKLLQGPENQDTSLRDQIAASNLRMQEIQLGMAKQQADNNQRTFDRDFAKPVEGTEEWIEQEAQKERNIREQQLKDATQAPLQDPRLVAQAGQTYLETGEIPPQFEQDFHNAVFVTDDWDDGYSVLNPANWGVKAGAGSAERAADVFVDYVRRKYPGFGDEAARKYFWEKIEPKRAAKDIRPPTFTQPGGARPPVARPPGM